VFYPRHVVQVERLPRNEAGKLTRAALLDLLDKGIATGQGTAPDAH
jgi:acyl-coenzyme A synthetase/AMP-(fatty) acid ligase